ncbi:MAG: hypothetical protein HOB40_08835 [Candidatus Marinimicrobia bacterium]|jgi:hypothetical protein|nr:hypothetical protein [Candidatus Neomarinimicrobiota bacterium]MBT3501214.1 hypothetical protein [Candidatus Neomarinimicrobiota bacterium]MBT3839495.1 hypothetical protein [Candidatus Neomarinimicrobiota bacterium]MBT3999396.1 hypothetical protein [Candidatus Neomarinimicrobiota bacterium]MBT4282520.1 hypothetical protein [Candidatus Neomarinimicrobiota bacterium]
MKIKINWFKTCLFCIAFFSISHLNSQEIPNEFQDNSTQKVLIDAGINWEENSLFGPIRFQSIQENQSIKFQNNDLLNIQTRVGIHSLNNSMAIYGFGHLSYKKYFYAYLYPRIVNDPDAFIRYSGIARDITRGGFSSGETDLSGIGFQNDWLSLQLGRGRENWGAGNHIQLALSENSPAYDYGMLGMDFNKLRVKYIHGFLETDESQINRYITARGVEWTNKKSLLIGLSETVIYSGENRSLDVGYFNPISTHLEIELNDRLNRVGTGNSNGVWQLSIDWLPMENLRVSGNILYDEFTLDKIQFEEGKENGKAYSARIAYSPVRSDNTILTLFSSVIHVGTPTFRHGSGFNNFVQRNNPLGWKYGSDGQEINFGISYHKIPDLIAQLSFGMRELGEESIINRPYDAYFDYLKGPFPSGEVKSINFIHSNIKWWWKPYMMVLGDIEWESENLALTIGLNIYWPKSFSL